MVAAVSAYLRRLIEEDNRIPLFVGVNALAVMTGVGVYLTAAPLWITLITSLLGILAAPLWLTWMHEMRAQSGLVAAGKAGSPRLSDATLKRLRDVTTATELAAARVTSITDDIANLTGTSAAGLNAATHSISTLLEMLRASYVPARQLTSISESLGTLLQTHREMTRQVSLLALNAAIEASRAGQPRGEFATIAEKVHGLAETTLQSTDEAARMLLVMRDRLAHLPASDRDAELVYHATEEEAQRAALELEAIASALLRLRSGALEISGAVAESHSVVDALSRSTPG